MFNTNESWQFRGVWPAGSSVCAEPRVRCQTVTVSTTKSVHFPNCRAIPLKVRPRRITGSPAQTLVQVSDCRGRSEGSTGLWSAESASRWTRERAADGPYCKGGSEINPSWGEPWARGSWVWSLGCSGGGGGGGRRQVQRRKQPAA